ncbi:hypothetical protein IFR05_002612 [Cadophora sp. M221]|nr:hypothetical protein IFR05_002612 [Cadophora sp. M221]
MQFLSSLALLLATSAFAIAAPAPNSRSDQALADATALICSQYPHSQHVVIGTLKVTCAHHEKRNPIDTVTDVDGSCESPNLSRPLLSHEPLLPPKDDYAKPFPVL